MRNCDLAWLVGFNVARDSRSPQVGFPPLYTFHLELEHTIDRYTRLNPSDQAELIADATEGYQDFIAGKLEKG